jgi:hypothetical protein
MTKLVAAEKHFVWHSYQRLEVDLSLKTELFGVDRMDFRKAASAQ